MTVRVHADLRPLRGGKLTSSSSEDLRLIPATALPPTTPEELGTRRPVGAAKPVGLRAVEVAPAVLAVPLEAMRFVVLAMGTRVDVGALPAALVVGALATDGIDDDVLEERAVDGGAMREAGRAMPEEEPPDDMVAGGGVGQYSRAAVQRCRCASNGELAGRDLDQSNTLQGGATRG